MHRPLNGLGCNGVDLADVRLLALYRLYLSLDCVHLFEQLLVLCGDTRGDRGSFLTASSALIGSFLDLYCFANDWLAPGRVLPLALLRCSS